MVPAQISTATTGPDLSRNARGMGHIAAPVEGGRHTVMPDGTVLRIAPMARRAIALGATAIMKPAQVPHCVPDVEDEVFVDSKRVVEGMF